RRGNWYGVPSSILADLFNPLTYGAPTIITGFEGININDSNGPGSTCFCVPPDGDMAAGPNYVIVGVNQSFRVFNKNGVPSTPPIAFGAFFDAGACGGVGLTPSDPIVAYDPVADRYTVGILRYDSSSPLNVPSFVSLAVSQSGNPTGAWNLYCFQQDYMGVGALYDFPHISVGQTALFTTGNLFPKGSAQSTSAR